jgi:hypothetical protein
MNGAHPTKLTFNRYCPGLIFLISKAPVEFVTPKFTRDES